MMPDGKGNWQWCPGATETEAQAQYVSRDQAYAAVVDADYWRKPGASQLKEAMDHQCVNWQVVGGVHCSVKDPAHFNVCVIVRKPNAAGMKVKKFAGQWHCYVYCNGSGHSTVSRCTCRAQCV